MQSVKRPSKQFARTHSAPESPISPSKGKKIAVVNHKSQNVILGSCVTLLSIKLRWVTTHTETDNRTEDARQSPIQSQKMIERDVFLFTI